MAKRMMKYKGDLPPLHDGISVIIAVSRPWLSFLEALESVRQQTIDHSLVSVIAVFNGLGIENIENFISYRNSFPSFNLKYAISLEPGAGRARNIGLSMNDRNFVTFLDDDDVLEAEFLSSIYEESEAESLIVGLIQSVSESGVPLHANTLESRIRAYAGKTVPLESVVWVLGFNAAKLIPTGLIGDRRYCESLKSGEDVAFFAQFLEDPNQKIHFVEESSDNKYLRVVSENSVSRQVKSFDFDVKQRLEVIKCLDEIRLTGNQKRSLDELKHSQLNFVRRYLIQNPEQFDDVFAVAERLEVESFTAGELATRDVDTLIFSYCFPPYSDPAAVVMAKILRSQKEYVDVVSADMGEVRSLDPSLKTLTNRWVNKEKQISVAPRFSSWPEIAKFGSKALRAAEAYYPEKKYRRVHSRALWSGSLVAAALYKAKYPETEWIAEFSDPLRWNSKGESRPGGPAYGRVARKMIALLGDKQDEVVWNSHFSFTEAVAIIGADKLIFTNENQREIMLSEYSEEIQQIAREKSKIRSHPILERSWYEKFSPVEVPLDSINLAYFGSFYPNRGLGELLNALETLSEQKKNLPKLTLFTPNRSIAENHIRQRYLQKIVKVEDPLKYLHMIASLDKFDVLIVNDAETNGGFAFNPFLPSKMADYQGSVTDIWKFVEEGSPMSTIHTKYSSMIGDFDEASNILNQIIMDHCKSTN